MFFFNTKKNRQKAKEALELEFKIQELKDLAHQDAENVTKHTKDVNTILYEKTDDIMLNIYRATGGDRR